MSDSEVCFQRCELLIFCVSFLYKNYFSIDFAYFNIFDLSASVLLIRCKNLHSWFFCFFVNFDKGKYRFPLYNVCKMNNIYINKTQGLLSYKLKICLLFNLKVSRKFHLKMSSAEVVCCRTEQKELYFVI